MDNYSQIIRENSKFVDFTNDDIVQLISFCQKESYTKGSAIIKEGDIGDKFYIIVHGEVGISKSISDEIVFFITNLKSGEFFGEMALTIECPRSANAFAKTDCIVMSIDRSSFNLLKCENPLLFGKFAWVLSKTLAERLYKIEERIKKILKASVLQSVSI